MPCSFSFAIGNPFFEKVTGSLQGLEISNMSFGVEIQRTAILRSFLGRRRQALMAFSSALAMTIANSPRIDRQRIRKLQPCLQRNSCLLCLSEIGGERRIDDNVLTIPYRCVRLEQADGLTDIVKCIRRFSFLQQGCSRAKDMACIMSVNTVFFCGDSIRRKLVL